MADDHIARARNTLPDLRLANKCARIGTGDDPADVVVAQLTARTIALLEWAVKVLDAKYEPNEGYGRGLQFAAKRIIDTLTDSPEGGENGRA